jgi:hypothetical protein
MPLYAFVGDAIVWAQLRTAKHDASDGTTAALAKIVPSIRKRAPKARIVVRADSGFCRAEILTWSEANRVDYVIGLRGNDRLLAELTPAMVRARERACLCGGTTRCFRHVFLSDAQHLEPVAPGGRQGRMHGRQEQPPLYRHQP